MIPHWGCTGTFEHMVFRGCVTTQTANVVWFLSGGFRVVRFVGIVFCSADFEGSVCDRARSVPAGPLGVFSCAGVLLRIALHPRKTELCVRASV